MATLEARASGDLPTTVTLSSAQTGTGASTNVADRRGRVGTPVLVTVTTTVGATPTCTYAIEGSVDGTNFFAVAFADSATPETVSVATFTVTTATTVRKILRINHPWRYLRVTMSSNTNVTNTITATIF